ncbi:MAG: cytochrome c3 family protein [Proteobacteria bacterium]|nr:hypothetical protein [Desulfobulbaceae bacterium]MBU4153998.1 cytochrome c3 family protein [Pseudomonadota bacterium]
MRILLAVFLIITALFLNPSLVLAVHDEQGDTQCLDCHQTLPFDREKLSYTEDVGTTCKKCHQNFPCNSKNSADSFSHPLEVTPSMPIPRDMPLTASGNITCITCHSYHAEFWDAEYNNESLLRRTKGMKLCHTCHQNFPQP